MNKVSTCKRCNQKINTVYQWNGEGYGPRCWEVLSGLAVYESKEYKAKYPGMSDEDKEFVRVGELEQSRVMTYNLNKYGDLIEVLESKSKEDGDFCWCMADDIKVENSNTALNDILRGRSFDIVRDIWGKAEGRKGSKKYKKAVIDFDERFNN